eukprot:6174042-Pleurochrysis_carterae.AAC.3
MLLDHVNVYTSELQVILMCYKGVDLDREVEHQIARSLLVAARSARRRGGAAWPCVALVLPCRTVRSPRLPRATSRGREGGTARVCTVDSTLLNTAGRVGTNVVAPHGRDFWAELVRVE